MSKWYVSAKIKEIEKKVCYFHGDIPCVDGRIL